MYDKEYMTKRFPDLVPVETVPSLNMVNGIGFGTWGERDFDKQTGTYVTTVYLFILFLPIFAFGAYRAGDAAPESSQFLGKITTQSWHFYGRVPMARSTKIFNWIVFSIVMSLVFLIWWK